MTYPASQNLYGSSIGNAPHRPYVISTADPTSHDVNYPLLQQWYNKSTQTMWSLTAFTSSEGIVSATWLAGGGSSVATDYVTDSGTATPSSNILNVLGGSGIDTSASGNTVTISLEGGGLAIDTIAVQATTAPGVTPVVPTAAGLVTLNGATVAAQTIPVQSRSIAANTAQIEVQRASTSASTNATQQGLASFDSASFAVDANGWVQLAGGGLAIDSITVDSVTPPGVNPVVPTAAGLITMTGTNGITTSSTATNQVEVNLTVPVTVPHGGTGATSFTDYAPICGGTTSTGALQSATTGFSTSGLPLISQGAAALPQFTALSASNVNGSTSGVAPAAGVIGQSIRSYVPLGSAVSLTTATPANVTSISLTAGVWDVTAFFQFQCNAATDTTSFIGAISATSATLPANYGDDTFFYQPGAAITGTAQIPFCVPSLRVTIGSTTTYYMVAQSTFITNATTVCGRISATRVG